LLLTLLTMVLLAPGAIATDWHTNGRIVYEAAGQIRIATADGSGSRRIAKGASPSWAPNGRVIAFQRTGPGGDLDIFRIYANGTRLWRISRTNNGSNTSHQDFDPAWAPNDNVIAFATDREGNTEIYRMNSDGHAVSALTTSPAEDRAPAWSPDGARISFVSNRDGNDDVYTMHLDGSHVRRLTSDPGADDAPSWSPDGRAIAFQSSRDGNWQIYTMSTDGSGLARLTNDPAQDTGPTWSPDGKRIAFTRQDDPRGDSGLFVVNALGGAARRVTAPGSLVASADWQPAVDPELTLRSPGPIQRNRAVHLHLVFSFD
jgi:Tol biopolymer transport system component